MIRTAMLLLVEQSLNRCLALQPHVLPQLAGLSGKVVKLTIVAGLSKAISLYILPNSQGLGLQNQYDGKIDAAVQGSPITLLRLAKAKGTEQLRLMREVSITGDISLIQSLGDTLCQVSIDWESCLSCCVGGYAAYPIIQTFRKLHRWGKDSLKIMSQNTAEYLQYEQLYLPSKEEVEDFFTEIHQLQYDIERLNAKLARRMPQS